MITQRALEQLAKEAGYQDPRDYAEDYDLARCEFCGRWGEWGDEVMSDGNRNYCEADRPKDEVQS